MARLLVMWCPNEHGSAKELGAWVEQQSRLIRNSPGIADLRISVLRPVNAANPLWLESMMEIELAVGADGDTMASTGALADFLNELRSLASSVLLAGLEEPKEQ